MTDILISKAMNKENNQQNICIAQINAVPPLLADINKISLWQTGQEAAVSKHQSLFSSYMVNMVLYR